jgi:hypothetical protein
MWIGNSGWIAAGHVMENFVEDVSDGFGPLMDVDDGVIRFGSRVGCPHRLDIRRIHRGVSFTDRMLGLHVSTIPCERRWKIGR